MFRSQCRFLLVASVCFSLVTKGQGQLAAAAGAIAPSAGDAGSPIVALILQFARGARDALRLVQRALKAMSRVYEAVSPELEAMGCTRKALFTRVIPPYLKPPWRTDGWAALTRRKRNLGGPGSGPARPFLVINGPLAPASPPQLHDLLEDFLYEAFGDASIIEAWRDFKLSWFGVMSHRNLKCAGMYINKRFWRWVNARR